MSGVDTASSAQTASTNNSTTSSQNQTSIVKDTAQKQAEPKAQARPSLPSLKRTPSFSVKDAMSGKIAPTATASQTSASDTGSDALENMDDIEESFNSMVEEVDFTPKNLEQVWNRLASHIKTSRPRIGNALLANKPSIIDDNLITFDVVNQLQKDELMTNYNEIISYIRKSLGMPLLELEFNVVEADSTNARPYTIDEKFKFMIQKNPAVLTLKQALGLDFE